MGIWLIDDESSRKVLVLDAKINEIDPTITEYSGFILTKWGSGSTSYSTKCFICPVLEL